MKRVDIVCDSSFDVSLLLTGYAGSVTVKEETGSNDVLFEYSGCDASFDDSNKGEMVAVFYGVIALKNYLNRLPTNYKKPSRINIYTDSDATIRAYNQFLDESINQESSYTPFMQRLVSEMKSLPITPTLKHVSAHIPNHLANPIEKEHNRQDKRAVKARMSAMQHIFTPDTKDSKWCSFLVPGFAEKTTENAMKNIATSIIEQGKKCRVAIDMPFETPEEHPFVEAIINSLNKRGLDPKECLYIPTGKLPHSFDRTLLRHHIYAQNTEKERSLEYERLNSADGFVALSNFSTASELIYGPLSDKPSKTGREHKASSRIFDLTKMESPDKATMSPMSRSQWLDKLSDYVMISHRFGFESAMRYAKLINNEKPSRLRSRQHTSLMDIIRRHQTSHDPQAMAERLVDVLVEFGYPNDDTKKERMTRFIALYPQKDPISLITAIERKSKTLAMAPDEPKIAKQNTKKVADALNRWLSKTGVATPTLNRNDGTQNSTSKIIATLLECGPILEKGQLCDRLVDEIINCGFPDVPAFREQMKRSLMNSREGNFQEPETLADFCLKQASRFARFIPPAVVKKNISSEIKKKEEVHFVQRRPL
jgi:ribonuclease HI